MILQGHFSRLQTLPSNSHASTVLLRPRLPRHRGSPVRSFEDDPNSAVPEETAAVESKPASGKKQQPQKQRQKQKGRSYEVELAETNPMCALN